jgi:hypothetical protein
MFDWFLPSLPIFQLPVATFSLAVPPPYLGFPTCRVNGGKVTPYPPSSPTSDTDGNRQPCPLGTEKESLIIPKPPLPKSKYLQMSFGASPSDIISVVTFCKTLYRKCRSTGGEYDEISHEVRGLHTVLRHLKYEVEAPDSPLYRDRTIWSRQLAPTIADCDLTLKQLDALILRHGSHSGTSSPEKARFGSDEMDQLGAIRVKLIRQKTSLTVILDNVQLPASKNTAASLDNTGGQLDIILDKVDSIAVRMGQRHDEDDREAWKQFRRELIAEGFSSEVLTQNEVRSGKKPPY